MNNQFGRRARLHLSLALVAVVIIHSGCSADYLRRQLLPPPPSEDLRAQLGRVRLSEGDMQTAVVFSGFPKGAGEGAAAGAGAGALLTIYYSSKLFGPFGSVGIFLAPVGALVGAVGGAVSAEPTATVEEKETAFRVAMEELKVPETFRHGVADRLPERTPTPGGPVSSDEPATTILEVVVERFGLEGGRFTLTERTRLIRSSDGAELYSHWLTYRGLFRPLDDWVSQNHLRLREEAARACRELAERLVDEVFFLYMLGGQRWDAR